MSILAQFEGHRVAVIGDLMLDAYMTGGVSRISPEAPVPVVRVAAEKVVPGGAANVAANLAALGLDVALVGLTGQDATRDALLDALAALSHVDASGVIALADRPTTRKLRIIGAHQQIVRVDHEEIRRCDAEAEARLIHACRAAIRQAEVVVISDYGKGVCSDGVLRAVINEARSSRRPILVDPKRTNFTMYAGAAVLTPNRNELSEATGLPCETDEEATTAARHAQHACRATIILTRSEKGMSLFPIIGEPTHLATVAQDVFDVSGAGDTVVATLAAGMAAKLPLTECMQIANHAAGIVVSKLGTATVSRNELGMALLAARTPATEHGGALVTIDEARGIRAKWAREKLTVGFTNGCFDLLHPGHVSLIRQAAASCDRLIVALNSDGSVRRLKGEGRPVQDERARAVVMGAMKGVAAVVLFDQDTPLDAIRTLQPDVLIKGADYTIEQVVGADIVLARDGRVLLAKLEPGHSTTALVAAAGQ